MALWPPGRLCKVWLPVYNGPPKGISAKTTRRGLSSRSGDSPPDGDHIGLASADSSASEHRKHLVVTALGVIFAGESLGGKLPFNVEENDGGVRNIFFAPW
jgi:hypothetical protein